MTTAHHGRHRILINEETNKLILSRYILAALRNQRPRVIGIASAFVTTGGIDALAKVLSETAVEECFLIAGTDNDISHPAALVKAMELGWRLRLATRRHGIFHPKLMVAGRSIDTTGLISEPVVVYAGSANLTQNGLTRNLECGSVQVGIHCHDSASSAFRILWQQSVDATEELIRNYSARFAETSRSRSAVELAVLGVSDKIPGPDVPDVIAERLPVVEPAIGMDFCTTAWAGLESFTGEYRFQVEFPQAAGMIIQAMIGVADPNGRVDVYCEDDRNVRRMTYRYYPNNGMFRLNIPNDVAGIQEARGSKSGIACVSRGPHGGAPLRMRIVPRGKEHDEIEQRSFALGTIGRTQTRLYGWY